MIPIILVATDEEYLFAKKYFSDQIVIRTGIGSLNVIRTLATLLCTFKIQNIHIVNVGYAGSNVIKKGTVVRVKNSCNYNWPVNVEYDCGLNEVTLSTEGVDCYSSNEFVTETKIKEPVVFDMELNTITAFPLWKVSAYKIVSDNLDYNEYEKFDKEESWKELRKRISEELGI